MLLCFTQTLIAQKQPFLWGVATAAYQVEGAYQTDGKGTYAVCGMEDTGTLQSLTWLSKAGKVDLNRVLVLRTASNYDQQREGITAAESLAETKVTKYSAYLSALDSAYRVGHVVVDKLVADWPKTRTQIPQ